MEDHRENYTMTPFYKQQIENFYKLSGMLESTYTIFVLMQLKLFFSGLWLYVHW